MSEGIDIDPESLELLARRHDSVAADIVEWAKPPQEWLDNFPSAYGTVANGVYKALQGYYAARTHAADALRQQHLNTAYGLRKASAAYQQTDHDGARALNNIGDRFQIPDARPGGLPSGSPPLHSVPAASAQHPGGPGGGPGGPGRPNGGPGPVPMLESPGSQANSQDNPDSPPVQPLHTVEHGTTPGVGIAPPADAGGSGGGGSFAGGPSEDRPPQAPPPGHIAPENGADVSSAGSAPFAAAVAAAAGKAARPVDVVGDDVNGDLMLARTLLGGVLAATESLVGIAWAVCVLRGPAGAGLFMTSNEGRGWLPAGLFLPREMSTPWLWDDLLGVQKTGSPWEGIADPARILSEFGTAWGSKANARITAVVSSGPIDPGMRASLPDVAMEGLVNPSSDLDLRTQIPGTTDRLGLTGSIDALKSLVTVGDSAIRSHCLDLAADAHAQVARSVPVSAAATRGRVLRDRIVATLRAGEPVTDALWRQLRDADDLLAAAMISLRTDVGGVGLGEIHADDAAARLRGVVFDRRCNELVLGLAGESNRQSLRDAVYAHEQVVAHPAFVAAPVSVSAHVPAPVTGDGSVTVSADYARPVERLREKADSPDADTGFESR